MWSDFGIIFPAMFTHRLNTPCIHMLTSAVLRLVFPF